MTIPRISKKSWAGIIGTLLLAVFSNALWEYIFKPSSGALFRWLLNISTLGMAAFKNQLYADIAKGFHENASLQLYAIAVGFLSALALLALLLFIFKKHLIRAVDPESHNKVIGFFKSANKSKILHYFSIIYLIFATTFFILDSVKIKYINDATSHYYQLINIVSPGLSQEEILEYNSKFSQIESKEDYVNLIQALENIAKEQQRKIPDFKYIF